MPDERSQRLKRETNGMERASGRRGNQLKGANKGMYFLTRQVDYIQKVRLSAELRLISLGKQRIENFVEEAEARRMKLVDLAKEKRVDEETIHIHESLLSLERYIEDALRRGIPSHPAYDWFSKVKGVGDLNIAKIVPFIDIREADTISSLWRYCGFGVDSEGKAEKRKPGEKVHYNTILKPMCIRLAMSLMRARGKFYEYFLKERVRLVERFESQGVKIVPAERLPKEGKKKVEKDGYISEGHVKNMALRKMIKAFLACLWLEWRRAENLPTPKPYPIDILGHTNEFSPEDFIEENQSGSPDKKEGSRKRRRNPTIKERARPGRGVQHIKAMRFKNGGGEKWHAEG
ncbi:MAG: hypothetical protein AB1466_01560 [Actinomycetota bacterium]